MIALSFGFFNARIEARLARRDSKLPTSFSPDPNDARIPTQLTSDNEPSYHMIAETQHQSKATGEARIF
jgi:hypothetical protein